MCYGSLIGAPRIGEAFHVFMGGYVMSWFSRRNRESEPRQSAGTPHPSKEAQKKQESPEALRKQANDWFHGKNGRKQDIPKAIRLLESAAASGDVESMAVLGQLYAGDALKRNMPESVRWLTMAAERGHVDSQLNLGNILARGIGVRADYVGACRWLTKAADSGDAEAQYHLATLHRDGLGVPASLPRAAALMRKSAEAGFAMAQYELGMMLATGRGCAENRMEAVLWLSKAAAQGHAKAFEMIRPFTRYLNS